MLNHETRNAILRLAKEGHGTRFIAHAVGVARDSVKNVLKQGHVEVPQIERTDQLGPHLEKVRELHTICGGNVVRVREELFARYGVDVAYSTLTRFCRKAEIGVSPKVASGRYEFEPGEEMQHDTSPHTVEIDNRSVPLQCASLVMCFSRRRFVQCYQRWTRFYARSFLTQALCFLDGVASRCMLDNSTIIMTGGTGPDAYAVPEMKAFADRFGFTFAAHRLGDANRNARVEGPFWHVERNFYPGRTFKNLADLNTQAIAWCQKYNASFHKSFAGVPDELGAIERPALKRLPAFVPEPTDIHPRRVNAEGYVVLHTNLYSVPEALIDRQLEVHETLGRVQVFDGHRLVAEHEKQQDGAGERVSLPEHRQQRRMNATSAPPSPEELALRAVSPEFAALCDVIRATRGMKPHKAIRRFHRIWLEYPNDVVESAVSRAMEFGLVDLDRIERMIIKNVRGDYFNLPVEEEDD